MSEQRERFEKVAAEIVAMFNVDIGLPRPDQYGPSWRWSIARRLEREFGQAAESQSQPPVSAAEPIIPLEPHEWAAQEPHAEAGWSEAKVLRYAAYVLSCSHMSRTAPPTGKEKP